jgi:hypothetical protein
MQAGADGSDQIAVDDNDGFLQTSLDVAGATIVVKALEGLENGTAVTLFEADTLTGTDSLNLMFDDASMWDVSQIASGVITFGTPDPEVCDPNTQGDVNGNGTVDFADFLILSANFGNAATDHTTGDVDCGGEVDFSDFLIVSANFGSTVPAASASASAVPEPSGFALLSVAGLLCGLRRRR